MLKLPQHAVGFLKTVYRKPRAQYWLYRASAKSSLSIQKSTQPAVLFLLPEAGIQLYIKTQAVIARQLKLQGYKVVFARCFNIFERCAFMDSENFAIDAKYKF